MEAVDLEYEQSPSEEHRGLMQSQDIISEGIKEQKLEILRTLHAVNGLMSAQRFCGELVHYFGAHSTTTRAALHMATVVAYARAFEEKPHYPVRHLRAVTGFDRELHQEILRVRHKQVAHSDADYEAEELGFHWMQVTLDMASGPETTMFAQAGTARLSTLDSLHVEALAQRYKAHIDATMKGITADLRRQLLQCIVTVNKNPENHIGPDAFSSSSTERITLKPGEPIPLQQYHLPQIDTPRLRVGGDGYLYRETAFTALIYGMVTVMLSDGREFALQVGPNDEDGDSPE